MQPLFLNLASRFFLPLKLLSISEASPFLFFPPFPRFFSSSDVFRCLDFSFSDFEKKKSVLMHLRLPLDSKFAQRYQKIAPEAILTLMMRVLFSRSIDWGCVAIFQGKAVWFSLLAYVSGGRLLFIIMKSIAVWCQRPQSLVRNNPP